MYFIYPAIFHEEEGSYWVEFPDLPGCHTYGGDIKSTMENAQEALYVHLSALLEMEQIPPSDSDIKAFSIDEHSFVSLVSCDVDIYADSKAVNKTLTIPSWLNKAALKRQINFSKTFQEALLVEVQKKEGA